MERLLLVVGKRLRELGLLSLAISHSYFLSSLLRLAVWELLSLPLRQSLVGGLVL